MSDDVEIRSGGVIAVDTEELRDIGRRLDAVGQTLHAAGRAVDRARECILWSSALSVRISTWMLRGTASRVEKLGTESTTAACDTLLMVDAYELVELRARQEALDMAQANERFSLQIGIDALIAANPGVEKAADALLDAWESRRFEGLAGELGGVAHTASLALTGSPLAAAFLGEHALRENRLGRIPTGAQLKGTAAPVKVDAVESGPLVGPPRGVAEALGRIPDREDGRQIRVEKYTMPNGEQRFVAYVRGTKASGGYGGSEPFDWKSNHLLYFGDTSSSYQAVLDALKAAGAQPGDSVMAVGHSQGGMIGSLLAMQSEYRVPVLVTAGSPTAPQLAADQQGVTLRHTDDVVSSLAGGGFPAGAGSPDSVVATREVRDGGLNPVAAHELEHYEDTAELVDDSDDPRLDAFQAYMLELSTASEMEATEYKATRL